jgi:large subunit ribosomal protein L16
MLLPKKTKYRKQFRGAETVTIKSYVGNGLAFGEFGLKAVSGGFLTSRQIEAARKAIMHYTKRGGKLWIRVFPDKPVSKKAAETRMGGGKSPVDHYCAVVKRGRIILEMSGVSHAIAEESLRRAAHKLPIKTRFVEEQ